MIDDVAQNVSLDLTSSTFSWAFSNLKLLVVGVDPKTKAASPENQTQGFLSSSWTKFRREWSTVGTLSSKDSCASARAGHAPVIEEIDKCASVLDEESRAYLQYVVTVPRTDSTKIEAFVKKVGEKIGQLRLIWQEKLKRLDFLSTDSRSTTANRRLVSAVLFAREWATHDFL